MQKKRRRDSIVRTAHVIYLLTKGRKMTTRDIALKTGLSLNGAWRMMTFIASSHHVPLTCVDGYWQIASDATKP